MTALAPAGRRTATEREILQQPGVWRDTAHLVAERRAEIDAFLAPLLARPDLRIVLTGAGTSAFVGEVAAPGLARRTGRRFDAIATTDLVADPAGTLAEDVPTLLVSFARSGDSPESVAAVAVVDRMLTEAHHLVITCDPTGELFRAVADRDDSLAILAPERANDEAFAMTSSFTAMLLVVLLTFGGYDDDVAERLAAAGEWMLTQRTAVQAFADRRPDRIVYLGSGPFTGLARESALKLLEMTAGRVATWFDSAMGFRHGPKAVLDDASAAVVYVSSDPYTRQYDEDIARELAGAIGPEAVLRIAAGGGGDSDVPGLDGFDDVLLALPFVVFAQLFALETALLLGVQPDDPFPGGSVNRVVRGVTIHPLPGPRAGA